MKGLEKQRVIVTGGASGIGKATAARFLEEGAEVVVLDMDREAGEKLATELPGLTRFIPCDVSDLTQVQEAIEGSAKALGGIDVLINNAGISIRHDDFLEITREEWEKVIGVNLNGAFFVAQTVARHMMGNDGGVILNTASTNGIMGYRYYTDYNASKAGVIELTKSLALEFAPRIRVNAIAPGYILTPMQRAEYTDEMLDEVNRKLPMKRHGTPEEVAALFAFLASEEAAYITGQIYVLDGGEIAGGLASR
jgi:meso-butanediol dehydrogenase/(S,S)-butanediol dehydrogenase/diacetyl reductase